jgi:hypothetical protein
MKFEFCRQSFEKVLDIKFNENPSSGSRVVPCGQTDMTKLIVVFRNLGNALRKEPHSAHTETLGCLKIPLIVTDPC